MKVLEFLAGRIFDNPDSTMKAVVFLLASLAAHFGLDVSTADQLAVTAALVAIYGFFKRDRVPAA